MDFLKDTTFLFDIIGSIAFGVSAALIAIKARMDLSGVIALSFIGGVGGGTIRDLILNSTVFWTINPIMIALPAGSGLLLFFIYGSRYMRSQLFKRTLIVFDTAGLAAFTAGGVSKALAFNQGWLVAIMMGALTATGGGIIRDLISGKIPVIFQSTFYITPTILGGLFYVTAQTYISPYVALAGCLLIVIAMRFLAEKYDWQLPSKSRLG